MSVIQWSSRFELGIPYVDEDHKTLIELVNRMDEALTSKGSMGDVGGILSALVDYTRYHFAREEEAQKTAGYPDLAEHQQQHNTLTQQTIDLFEAFRDDPTKIDVGEILDFMSDWLMDHILLHDMAMRPYVQASKQAAASAETINYLDLLSDDKECTKVDWPHLSILVLEDSKAFASVLHAILKNIGVGTVTVTETIQDGIVKALVSPYDIVISDWRLAESNGADFIRQLREIECEAPVIVLSGYVDEGRNAETEKLGVAEWLQKPVTSAELAKSIRRHLPCK